MGDLDFDPSVTDVRELARLLGTDPVFGLTGQEATRRLAADGPNEIQVVPAVPTWRKVLAQFQDPLIYLLLAAVAVSVAAWAAQGGDSWPVDAIVILAIVVLNAVLGYVQQARAENAVAALRRMTTRTAVVVRDREQVRVPAREVVVGDLLVLAEGDSVAADGRLVSAATLKVAEAALTGESEPVLKDTATLADPVPLGDRLDMVFSGTAVTQGTGRALVTATGMDSEMGHIAGLLHATKEDPTPLQREMARVGRMLGIAVLVIAAVVVATVLLISGVDSAADVVTVLLLGVSLAVAAVPEGLPAILSVVLAIGVRRMAAQRAIVKKLSSVETLGSASVICSDKTGTLTKNEMTIERVVTASGETRVTGAGYRPDGRVEHDGAELVDGPLWQEVFRVLTGGSLANNAVLRVQIGEEVVPLDDARRARVLADVNRLSAQALRTLGVAYRRLEQTTAPDLDESIEHGLVYVGMVGIIDPPRPEAAEAIRLARRAGIRTIMITGDHPLTAARIADDLGIVEPRPPVLTGSDLSLMDGSELAEAVRRTSVYARVSPAHKLAIVDALQADGNIVAMTGDGVNDAPALKAADIGIAMGTSGTEVTKEAANMILADDNFATIVRAVR